MSQNTKYAILLAAGLVVFYLIGNKADSSSSTLSLFPGLLALLPFPLVLYTMLRRLAREDKSFTVRQGIRTGEAVVRRAAVLFSLFNLVYSHFFFDGRSPYPIWFFAVAGIGTLIATWLVGVVFAALCAWVAARVREGGRGEATTEADE
ncbi:MAG TPA: hypothetical protein EYM39_04190 [Candidatus Latescibacteria bacterium]|nr:hypothetical protein [Candidatus Latescibacterota bacterium]